MILQITASSERGKDISKCANSYVKADITFHKYNYAFLFVNNEGDITLSNGDNQIVFQATKKEWVEFSPKLEEIQM